MVYVWAAFSVTWLVIFLYTLSLGRRQNKLAQEVAHLEEWFARQEKRG